MREDEEYFIYKLAQKSLDNLCLNNRKAVLSVFCPKLCSGFVQRRRQYIYIYIYNLLLQVGLYPVAVVLQWHNTD